MPEEVYPSLNGAPEVTSLRMLTPEELDNEIQDELREQQQPLNVDGMTAVVVSSARVEGLPNNGNGVNNTSAANPGRGPQRKVKFLQKLVNFCGDPKRREQTCSARNKMFAFCFICSIIGLICSVLLVNMMWFTSTFNDMLLSRLALLENSQSADWWAHPPYQSYLRVHIFNYTNVEAFNNGEDDKLKIEDLGPYTYIERVEKIDVKYHPDQTITYRENRSYEFSPELSVGSKYDPVFVPNLPLNSAFEMRRTGNFLLKFGINRLIDMHKATLFKRLPADSFLWGYEDGFVTMASAFKPMPFENFGVLVLKNGTSDDVFRIHSGEGDINQMAAIQTLNDKDMMDFWTTDKCNKVEGTDGSQFPPSAIQNNESVQVYIKDICRKFVLEYEEDVSVFGDLPAKRYRAPLSIFSHPKNKSENECYCPDEERCPPGGVFDASVCTHDAPIFVSFPHFYSGDPILYEKFEGIEPVKDLHATYADLHPRMGYPMQFASRFQINVRIPEGSPTDLLGNIQEGDILPVIWMELMPAEFPEDIQNAIYHSSFTANFVENILKYGSIASTSAIAAFILYMLVAIFYLKRTV